MWKETIKKNEVVAVEFKAATVEEATHDIEVRVSREPVKGKAGKWYVTCTEVGVTCEALEAADLDAAKVEALRIVSNAVQALTRSLMEITHVLGEATVNVREENRKKAAALKEAARIAAAAKDDVKEGNDHETDGR